MSVARPEGHTTTLLPSGKVLVAGGWSSDFQLSSAELFDEESSAVMSPILTGTGMLSNGSFQFTFTNIPGARFRVLATSDFGPRFTNWVDVGSATETTPGLFQFTNAHAIETGHRFYRVSSRCP